MEEPVDDRWCHGWFICF